jgi:hypothetical protein
MSWYCSVDLETRDVRLFFFVPGHWFLASGLACHGSAAAEAAESQRSYVACSGGVGGGVGIHAAAYSASTRLGKALSD